MPVRLTQDAGVALVEIDAPPVNTLGNEVLERLRDIATELREGDGVRAVVITGCGEKAFASGADLREFQRMLGSDAEIAHHTALTREAFGLIERLDQPVVAAVQAAAVGGGLELALCCDVIVADERARLGLPEVTLGLIPGAGGTQRLPARVGRGRAATLILSGELLRAVRAAQLGLVDEVAPAGQARDHALALAARLAGMPRVAVQAAKRAVRASGVGDLAAGLDAEHQEFLRVLASADAREGVEAFLGRRAPFFTHR